MRQSEFRTLSLDRVLWISPKKQAAVTLWGSLVFDGNLEVLVGLLCPDITTRFWGRSQNAVFQLPGAFLLHAPLVEIASEQIYGFTRV